MSQVRDGTNPSNVYGNATDIAIANFPYAMNSPITFSLNSTSYRPLQGYSFYTGTIQDVGYQMTLDIHADVSGGQTVTQSFIQTLLLDNTPLVAPGTVQSVVSTTVGQATTATSSAAADMQSWRMLSLISVVCGMSVLMSMVS